MEKVEPIRDLTKLKLVKRILKEDGSRNFLIFLIGINSGLRISDILKLKVKDVQGKDYIEIKEKKTGKYKRFPITDAYSEELKIYIIGKSPDEWLFSSHRDNKPLTRIQAYRMIKNACKKAGITERIGTHTLRKTFGYHHYQKFKDIALLQSILNHSAPCITLAYIGINQDIIDDSLRSFKL